MSNVGYRAPSALEIENWIIKKVAELLKCKPAELDPREPFASYGLDSIAAVTLAGDLEQWLNRNVEATAAWDYPSIELLARFLASES